LRAIAGLLACRRYSLDYVADEWACDGNCDKVYRERKGGEVNLAMPVTLRAP